eukprot:scaffold10382_cov65-Phaeocystis_antarctica.AAC.1
MQFSTFLERWIGYTHRQATGQPLNTGENKVGRTLHATFTRARFSSRTVYSARGAADQKRDLETQAELPVVA